MFSRFALSPICPALFDGYDVANIHLCLDSDKAGKEATARIIGELLNDKRFSDKRIIVTPPPIGKDYADTAKAIQQLNMKEHKISRSHEAVF